MQKLYSRIFQNLKALEWFPRECVRGAHVAVTPTAMTVLGVALRSAMPSVVNCVLAGIWLILIPAASWGASGPKVALHVGPHSAKNMCSSMPTLPCNAGEENFETQGDVGVSYDVLIFVADVEISSGFKGLSVGLSYDATDGSGVDVFGWTSCSDLAFLGPVESPWPASNGKLQATWVDCKDQPAEGDLESQATILVGMLYVYAYSDDALSVVHPAYPPDAITEITACALDLHPINDSANLASVAFGSGSGWDPCAPIDSIPPEGVEDLGEGTSTQPGLSGLSVESWPVLTWTAPADDGGTDKVSLYEIRYMEGVAAFSWDQATRLTSQLANEPGAHESTPIDFMEPSTEYEFAVVPYDEAGNSGPISNIASIVAPIPEESFSLTIECPGSILYAGIDRHESSWEFKYENSKVTINGTEIFVSLPSPPEPTEEQWSRRYEQVAFVMDLRSRGVSWEVAEQLHNSASENLRRLAEQAYVESGNEAALQVYNSSPLVEQVVDSDRWWHVTWKGVGTGGYAKPKEEYADRPPRPRVTKYTKALALAQGFMEDCELKAPMLTFVGYGGGSWNILALQEYIVLMDNQLQDILNGTPVENVLGIPHGISKGTADYIIEQQRLMP